MLVKYWSRLHREFWNLLLDALMWLCLIEIRDVGTQDTMHLLLDFGSTSGQGTLAEHSSESVHR